MAEEPRLTKKERRAQARAERKRKEAAAQKKARRQRWTTLGVTALILLGVGAIVWQAFAGGDSEIVEGETVSVQAYADARQSAGCEVVSDQELAARDHLDPASAPPADVMYAGGPRPTHSGPHFSATHPVVEGGLSSQGDERALTHNLEHGAIIVWYDPETVESGTVDELEGWAEGLNESGFTSQGGGAIFVSPYTEPGISSGKPLAIRAWGIAMDCDSWDETVGNGFVIERYGTHGNAPENMLSPYPDGVLGFSDRSVEDNPQGTGDTHGELESPAPDATEGETTTEEPSPAES